MVRKLQEGSDPGEAKRPPPVVFRLIERYGSTYRNEVKTMFSSECGAPLGTL
jgi:hypothetical protein